MYAKIIPTIKPSGKRVDVAAMYGLTLDEFNSADMSFLQNEGYADDGHECETLHGWLTYTAAPYRDNTPWQKGDDQPI